MPKKRFSFSAVAARRHHRHHKHYHPALYQQARADHAETIALPEASFTRVKVETAKRGATPTNSGARSSIPTSGRIPSRRIIVLGSKNFICVPLAVG